jgi:hypothetical protein
MVRDKNMNFYLLDSLMICYKDENLLIFLVIGEFPCNSWKDLGMRGKVCFISQDCSHTLIIILPGSSRSGTNVI